MTDKPESEVQESPVMGLRADTSIPIGSLPETIRRRAYELFETPGRQPGHELDDWLAV